MTSASAPASVYEATIGTMAGLVTLTVAVAALLIFLGGRESEPALVAAGLFLVALLVVARLRLRLAVEPERLVYRSLLVSREMRLSELESARWAADGGFLASRLYGPFVYEIRGPNQVLRINLKLFSRECSAHIVAVVQSHLADRAVG